jgi:hypothetical protein
MNLNKPELQSKLELGHLLKAINYLGNQISSADDIHSYSESPIHMLVHNEILKHSKEDIDNFKEQDDKTGRSLYSVSFGIRNPYIFSAFMKIGAFQNRLSESTKWLLKQKAHPSNDLYALIYEVEYKNADKRANRYPTDNSKLPSQDILFNLLLGNYSNKLDTPEKIELVDTYFKEFGKKMEDEFIHYVYLNYRPGNALCEYLVVKLKNNGVDFSKNSLLNNSLPKERYKKDEDTFFISSSDTPKIKQLLEVGFTFDEKSYSFHGDNLFVALAKASRFDVVGFILPHLKDITPKSGTLEEQNAFIDSLSGNRKQEEINLIKTTYRRLLIESQLVNKNDDVEQKRRVKI